jgi:S-DNA-T family DNA segregation ATPase FtsK/SpoIIIE
MTATQPIHDDDPTLPDLQLAPAPFAATYTMVDGVVVDEAAAGPVDLPPIIPGWVRSRDGRRAMTRTTAARWRYVAMFHGLRIPLYWCRLARRAPIGAARVVVALGVWTADTSVKASLQAMRAGIGGTGLERMERQHQTNVRFRLAVDVALLAVAVAAAWLWSGLPLTWKAGTAAVALPVLGFVGRNRERPIVERVIFHGVEVPKLSESLIVQALISSRIQGMAQAFKEHGDKAIRWIKPPTRTKVGYEVILDLPSGITVDDAAGKVSSIASGLSRPTSTVWLSGLQEEEGGHEGRLRMVVTDTPLRSGPAPRWPLADSEEPFDIFRPIPLGVDYLGEPVTIRLMFRSGIVGALPRMGKTFMLRQLLLAAALDPTVEIHCYDLKGGADFLSMGQGIPRGTGVCHAFRSGSSPDDAAAMLADLRQMKADMERRYAVIRRIVEEDVSRCPEGKVTRELADDRSLGLHPVVLAIDETQVCFADWADAKELVALVTDIAKRGPAAGMITLLATQNVDAATIPKSISRMASIRFCMRVTDHTANDQILGTGAYSRGFRASELSMDDQGIGYLAGEGDMTKLVRCCLVDGPMANEIVARARRFRESAGRLTGLAAGIGEADTGAEGLVEHAFAVWPEDAAKIHCATLAERLAEFMPGAYDGISGDVVTLSLKAHGVPTKQMKIRGKVTTGVAYDDLAAVVEARAESMAEARTEPAPDDQPDDLDDDEFHEVAAPWDDDYSDTRRPWEDS